ncbi:hypothetical protein FH972_015635 [Carpinus fangiana]|uniref:glucan endo-1,3-beta-D-glucosidase n=1 Tax=Carpinus fangiana TaxID=176857 RepID=A0A5N6RF86_9ROSI|nr:hypothetical protein FH972_015635 [Carpinus fangiana]
MHRKSPDEDEVYINDMDHSIINGYFPPLHGVLPESRGNHLHREGNHQMKMKSTSMIWITVLSMAIFHHYMVFGVDLGINYGRTGNDLPSPKAVVDFLTKTLNYAIPLVRLFYANLEVLEALRGTNLVVTIGVPNVLLTHIASSQDAANSWVNDHIKSFIGPSGVSFRYIVVGSNAILGIVMSSVPLAMENIYQALKSAGLSDRIKVTTAVYPVALSNSYPPSNSTFCAEIADIMYKPVLIDGNYEYYNLFDAMVDAFVAAMARAVGKEDVNIVVSETGWPTEGNEP